MRGLAALAPRTGVPPLPPLCRRCRRHPSCGPRTVLHCLVDCLRLPLGGQLPVARPCRSQPRSLQRWRSWWRAVAALMSSLDALECLNPAMRGLHARWPASHPHAGWGSLAHRLDADRSLPVPKPPLSTLCSSTHALQAHPARNCSPPARDAPLRGSRV